MDKTHRRSYLHPTAEKHPNRKQPQLGEPEPEAAARSERAQPPPQHVDRSRSCLARVSAITGDLSELSQAARSKLSPANQPRHSSPLTLHVELIGSGGPASETPEILWLREELGRLVSQRTPKGRSEQRKTQQVMIARMQQLLQQLEQTRQPAISLTIDGKDLLRKVVFRPFTRNPDPLSTLAVGDEVEVQLQSFSLCVLPLVLQS